MKLSPTPIKNRQKEVDVEAADDDLALCSQQRMPNTWDQINAAHRKARLPLLSHHWGDMGLLGLGETGSPPRELRQQTPSAKPFIHDQPQEQPPGRTSTGGVRCHPVAGEHGGVNVRSAAQWLHLESERVPNTGGKGAPQIVWQSGISSGKRPGVTGTP